MTKVIAIGDIRQRVYQAHKQAREELASDQANGLRGALQKSFGGQSLNVDQGALRESMYVQDKGGSDYDARLDASKAAYTGNSGHWPDIVRQVLGSFAYTEEHFNERVAPEQPLPAQAYAAVATFLAYGFWWQMGHFNVLTDRWERRSWFIDPILRWVKSDMAQYARNFEGRVLANL